MFHKVIFTRTGHGATAGLIIDSTRVDPSDVVAVSRLFPWSAAPYMRTYHVSPPFETWAEAFAYVFPMTSEGLRPRV